MRHLWVEVLFVLLAASAAQAQTPLGTAFTYQGQLKQAGAPYNVPANFEFRLWDAVAGGTQIGLAVVANGVPVTNGLFTVTLDFGAGAFAGDARWLEIQVNGTPLAPRQALTATPYALYALNGPGVGGWGLTGNAGTDPAVNFLGTTDNQPLIVKVNNQRVLRLEPTASTANVIAGSSANLVGIGFIGAAIGGGGAGGVGNPNEVQGNYGVVAGGKGNVAGGRGSVAGTTYSTVGGGAANRAEWYLSTISGGANNLIAAETSGAAAVIGGGAANQATQSYATIAGGQSNIANGGYGTIGGGLSNQVQQNYGVVGGGVQNIAAGVYSAVGGGLTNTASGSFATVPGGDFNAATAAWAFAAGRRAKANDAGSFVWADSTDADFATTEVKQFLIRAAGNVGINTNEPTSPLTVNGQIESRAVIWSTAGGFKFPDGNTLATIVAGGDLTGNYPNPTIANNAVTSAKIAEWTIVADDIAAATITRAEIAAATITATEIAANTITNVEIKNNTIVPADIDPAATVAGQALMSNGPAVPVVWGNPTPGGVAGGDLGGAYPLPTVVGLRGRAVGIAPPNGGEVLKWNAVATQWQPAADNDTTYAAGVGLTLNANQFALDAPYTDARYVNEGQLNSITSAMIADGQVTNADIADNGVTAAKIATDAVGAAEIAAGAVGSGEIADLSVALADLAANSVDSTKIVDATVALADLAANSVNSVKIVDGSVALADLAADCVDSTKIANGTVALADLAANSVDSTKIVDASVALADLAANSVNSTKIVDGAVTFSKLSDPLTIGATYWDWDLTSGEIDIDITADYPAINIENTATTYGDCLALRSSAAAGTSTWVLYAYTQNGNAGYFSKSTDDGTYALYVASPANNSEGLYVYGNTVATGTKSAAIETSQGPQAIFSVESPEVEIYASGSAQLTAGAAYVELDPLFAEAVSPDVEIRVTVTPVGGWSALYVESTSPDGFLVRSATGDLNVRFHWMACGRRLGYEDRPYVPIPAPDEDAAVREYKERARAARQAGR
jgi:hypothetical protein